MGMLSTEPWLYAAVAHESQQTHHGIEMSRTRVNWRKRGLYPAIIAHSELDLWWWALAKIGSARIIRIGGSFC